MEVCKGRPAERRGETEEAVYDFLEGLSIDFLRIDHAPARTMEDCRAIDGMAGFPMCKNLFLANRQETECYLLLMPPDKPFRTAEVSRAVGSSRLSFASAERMGELLSLAPGAVSVMGLLFDKSRRVHLYLDRDLLTREGFGCHPAVNTASIFFPTEELLTKVLPALGRELRTVELG